MPDLPASLWRSIGALAATDPATWLASHLAPRFQHYETYGRPDHESSFADLIDGEIEKQHQRLVANGVPPAAAAHYVVGWYGGVLAGAVGFGIACGGCGFLVDPARVRWQVHADGWVMGVTLAPHVVVEADHPWACQPGVEAVADAGTMIRRAVDQLIEACAPIVERGRALARVGRVGLWNEVGDALAGSLSYEVHHDVTEVQVEALRRAGSDAAVPWLANARLEFVDSASVGRVHVVQRGGCCLAYTERPEVTADSYCSTCSLRDADDAFALQLRWIEERRASRATGSGDRLVGAEGE